MEPLMPEDPRVVGPFQLVGRLGEGAMGIVYLGHGQGVVAAAVKVIQPGLALDDRFLRRFKQEIRTLRRVTSPLVAALIAADAEAAPPWLASVYVPGPSLEDFVERRGPLPYAEVLALGSGLAEALAEVHAVGVVHRDVKPANVVVTAAGPRLIDFGIARAEEDTRLTRTGGQVGTPAYMAPEQAAGRSDVGPAADVYAFGGVLCFAATGHRPGRDLSQLPGPLAQLVGDCLRDDPRSRPTAEDLLARCRKSAPEEPVHDEPRHFHVGDNSVGSVSFGGDVSAGGGINIGNTTHIHGAPEKDPFTTGLAALQMGQYTVAVSEFEKAARAGGDVAEASFHLAVALFDGRRPGLSKRATVQRVERELARTLAADPGHAPSLMLSAIIKDDYYLPNGFDFPPPGPRELFRQAVPTLDPAAPWIALLLAHVATPASPAWRYLQELAG